MRLCLLFVAYEIVRKENAHQTESQTTETISKAKLALHFNWLYM